MSLTQTTTMTQVEPLSDLQQRLQPFVGLQDAQQGIGHQVRYRGSTINTITVSPSTNTTSSKPELPTLTRRFSFVWPFVSKESSATSDSSPFLSARCSQLLRQFPAYLSGRRDAQFGSGRGLRDTISRVLQHLNRLWLVLAVYMAVVVLAGLSAFVSYSFWCAAKPLGLWFLVGCIGATGVLAVVCFSSRAKAPPALLAQDSRANLQ